jgi:chitin-binding protein
MQLHLYLYNIERVTMKNFNKVALITIVAVTSAQAFAHGWQTKPISRAEFLYKTNPAAVGYEPQSVASLLTSGGSSSYADIKSFVGGPLGFFKKNHDIQSGALCTNGHSNWLSLLNAIAPTSVVNGQSMTISWTNTAPHRPSNYFVFITNYKAGEYNQAPSWQDLHYVSGCDLNGEGVGAANILPTTTWPCKMQLDNQNIVGKQVMVTIWQRVDPVGENFISCSDLNFGGSVVTPPQDL